MPAKQGIGPFDVLFEGELAVGINPTVRMGFSPSAVLDYQAGCGGSKLPPYGWALEIDRHASLAMTGQIPHSDGLVCPRSRVLVHPLCWIIGLVAVGVNPHRTE